MKLITQIIPPRKASRKRRKSDPRPNVNVSELANMLRRILAAGVTSKTIRQTFRQLKEDHALTTRRTTRRGTAKGRGQSSKGKGRSAVQLTRDYLLRTFDLKEDDILVKATSMGGCDLHMSPHAQSWFPFAIEVKNVEKLAIWAALAQAEVNAKRKQAPPVLFFKRARSPLYVAFHAAHLLDHLKETYVAPAED